MNKTYIFISHSHKDIDRVRILRNFLEEQQTEPILFFLLSQSDEDEVAKLIKDEIAARIWFIYCESENARNSKWCQTELQYAQNYPKYNILRINLDDAFDASNQLKVEAKEGLFQALQKIKFINSIFFAYSLSDKDTIMSINECLEQYNIHITDDLRKDGMVLGHDEMDIEKYFFVFVSNKSRDFLYDRLYTALKHGKNCICVVLGKEYGCEIFDDLQDVLPSNWIQRVKPFIFDTQNIEKSCDEMIHFIYEFI